MEYNPILQQVFHYLRKNQQGKDKDKPLQLDNSDQVDIYPNDQIQYLKLKVY